MRKTAIVFILLFCVVALGQDKPYRILNSFNAGELTPLLTAREDLSKYQSGCSLMENMIPLPQGGAQKRPGTIYVAESKNNTKIRLIPFQYSTTQSYIIELGNQYMRFFTNNAVIYKPYGTEDLSDLSANIIAHWLCDDNAGNTTVVDDDGATHNGTASSNTNTLTTTDEAGTANEALDLGGTDDILVTDHANFSFGNGTTDSAFSIAGWVQLVAHTDLQIIMSKYQAAGDLEWYFYAHSDEKLYLHLTDDSAGKYIESETKNALTAGWHFIAVTYTGSHNINASFGQDSSRLGMRFFVDWVEVPAIVTKNESGYVAMESLAADVNIGSYVAGTKYWQGKIDNLAIFNKALNTDEIAALTGSNSTTPYEVTTPYLTADLYNLKYEQSADVLYITHPDYEPRKLSRWGNSAWSLDPIAVENGPFRAQNENTEAKVAASATSGSITLTATGCTPFVDGTTAGHESSGSTSTSKSRTGALFKLVQPLATLEYSDELDDNYTDDQTENVSWLDCGTVYNGTTWYLTTLGTWTGTLELQRNYTIGAAHDASGWETADMPPVASTDDRNVDTSGTEDIGDASYRAILTESGDNAEQCKVYFRTDQTEHIGIVEITAVASTTSATGTVLKTLASTNATHKWSEGSWSNYRGWPRTVTFFEDRLVFGGNSSQPDTIWASVTADYENMTEGVDDDDSLSFTLSSRQVNIINWLIGKDKILIGTSGAEWTLSGTNDEPLAGGVVPKAEQHSTYGSANLQAVLANESVFFFQRGAERMRELAYNWELDSYVAPDMTILAKEVTGDGITDVAFQQIPDAILWCVRDDGNIATFSYERKENITAWSRQITDGDFESVAVIHGTVEDEVWVSVERSINSSTVRYIEYFSPRDFGSDLDDAFYVDSGYTYDSTATTSITELGHLIAEEVSVFGDSVIQTSQTVDGSGDIAITSALTVQVGLPYTVQMRTMPLSWVAQGMTIHGRIKRINEVITSWYNSGDFSIGRDSSTLETYSITGMTTNEERKTFPAGYDRYGYVFIYQLSPEPLTVLALMTEFKVR